MQLFGNYEQTGQGYLQLGKLGEFDLTQLRGLPAAVRRF